MNIDFNCDLGEGEPLARIRGLMPWITSANVACGGHAGDLKSMETCVRLAQQGGVRLGAHPGPWGRGDRGRGTVEITPDELQLLLLLQISALEKLARRAGTNLHHIKLHGALYHATESKQNLARRYLEAVQRWWPKVKVYALAGGTVARLAPRNRVEVWEEAFADRGYRDDGSLVPRTDAGALLTDVKAIKERVQEIVGKKQVTTVTGQVFQLRPKTICLHSDTPNALIAARAIGRLLRVR